MIQSSIGRRNVDNRPFEKPLSIYIDEASNSLYMGIENLFNKSRSANVMISAFSQSFADLDDAVGKEKAKMILANTNTKIFLKLVDIDTAESVARYGGESTQYSSLISSQNLMMREDKKEILEPRMFLDLKPREFFYFGFEGSFKGKVKKVSGSEIKVVMPKKGN
jgi:type IV secretory pathway TraG/TraD family ATPase VirD4